VIIRSYRGSTNRKLTVNRTHIKRLNFKLHTQNRTIDHQDEQIEQPLEACSTGNDEKI
jgi:hypothetical protein